MFGRLLSLFERKDATTVGWAALVDASIQTAAGITVSPSSALRCVPVMAGVRVRCETLGSLPIHLYQRDSDGGKARADKHPLYRLLHDRPNPWTSAPEFVMALERDCILHGHGYAAAVRVGDKIIEMIRLEPTSVSSEVNESFEPTYKVTLNNGGERKYRWQDILHIQALGGLSAIKQASDAIGLCMALERHGARIFSSGGRPSGVLKYAKKLPPDKLERLRQQWDASHAGEASGKTALLEDGLEFEPLTFNSVDLQYQELRLFQVVEIARALGVPPVLLFDFARATWGNSEQMAQAFLTFTLLPRMKIWQGAISRLLSAEEQKNLYAEFLIDELTKADVATRFAAYASAISSRVLNPNEARAMENRSPYAGGEVFANPNTESTVASPKADERSKPRIAA